MAKKKIQRIADRIEILIKQRPGLYRADISTILNLDFRSVRTHADILVDKRKSLIGIKTPNGRIRYYRRGYNPGFVDRLGISNQAILCIVWGWRNLGGQDLSDATGDQIRNLKNRLSMLERIGLVDLDRSRMPWHITATDWLVGLFDKSWKPDWLFGTRLRLTQAQKDRHALFSRMTTVNDAAALVAEAMEDQQGPDTPEYHTDDYMATVEKTRASQLAGEDLDLGAVHDVADRVRRRRQNVIVAQVDMKKVVEAMEEVKREKTEVHEESDEDWKDDESH